ncbi:MAG: DegT/DnrJ/EryC1/StrS family aminotransferase [Vicinamibacterales bacterium]
MALVTTPGSGFAPPCLGQAEIDEVVATLQSGWLSTGPRVRRFEAAFADYVGARHAIAVNSCTAALHLALLALDVGVGDEVITTPMTFCATANVVVHTGATPRFVDIDPVTWNITPAAASAAITPYTRVILPVHYAGRPADLDGFRTLATRHGAAVVDDAAHAVEAVSAGVKVGTGADISCFSFYATKNLTTGEGGMVTTGSEAWAAFMRTASLHGISRDGWARYGPQATPHYDVLLAGYKYNMMDLQAAIGLRQLAGLPARLARREAVWRTYDALLADLPVTRPAPVDGGDRHARHLYTILVDPESGWTRDALAAHLAAQGIATSVHFRALHLQPYYQQRFALRRGMFPVAERVSDAVLSLPLHAGMADGEAERVGDAIRRAILGRAR